MNNILTTCLGSLVLVLSGACTSDNAVSQLGSERHRIEIVLSGNSTTARVASRNTRTLVSGNPALVHPELSNPRSVADILNPYLDNMVIGSTVRLLVWPAVKNSSDSKWQRKEGVLPLNRTFVVSGDVDTHLYYLRPCLVNSDGSFKSYGGSPLILENGDWIIYASSPALPLDDNAGLKLDNGQEYMSSDWRYTETYPTYFHLEPTDDDVIQMTLNPIIHQNARLILSLYSENEFISSVDLLNAGVHVNGLQRPVYYTAANGAQYSMNYADTLKTLWGKKNEKLVLLNKYIAPVKVRYKAQDGSDSIVTYRAFNVMADILPTEATSQPLNILFSGVVNGVPANFSYNLNEKVFRPGYYYHYLGKIDIKEGVVVLDWGSNNWEADVDLNYNESQYETTDNR